MSRLQLSVVAVVAGLVVGGTAFYLGRTTAGSHGQGQAAAPAAAASGEERRVLYWHDPMVPGQRFDKPGKSPFMDMPLQPVYADEANESGVKVSSQVQQNLGIRTATVNRADVTASFDAVGAVQFDERLNVAVQTRTAGYLERLNVRAPMERVAKGQALGIVFAPEWLGPLNEIVALKRSGASPELVSAARERTRAMSIPAELVRRAEESGTPDARYTLLSPASGVVAELGVREGEARIECDRAPELSLAAFPVVFVPHLEHCQRRVRFRGAAVELHGFLGGFLGPGTRSRRRNEAFVVARPDVRVRQPGVSSGEGGIQPNALLELRDGLAQVLFAGTVEEVAAPEVRVVALRIQRLRGRES